VRERKLYFPQFGQPLTRRERQIYLLLVTEGLTDKEIAAFLYVGVDGIKVRMKHIHTKLGVHSRAKMIAQYWKNGKEEDNDSAVSNVAVNPMAMEREGPKRSL
jgi:DNA-binding NarL/FixJ family response regulator